MIEPLNLNSRPRHGSAPAGLHKHRHLKERKNIIQRWAIAILFAMAALVFGSIAPRAQNTRIEIRGAIPDLPRLQDNIFDPNTTVVPRSNNRPESADTANVRVQFEARLTRDSARPVTEGVIWRIFSPNIAPNAAPQLLRTLKISQPNFLLPPGIYYVNAAFGRANLTRRITVLERGRLKEVFILNAGGFKADVRIAGSGNVAPLSAAVRIDIYSDESDQSGAREKIVAGAKPGQVIRLNAGIYHVESRIGDANAFVKSEVSVEAGKITEARVEHEAAIITFRLVASAGGEAIPGTVWAILTETGQVVKESVGALPQHVLAPGRYIVSAGVGGRSYRRTFAVTSGLNADVELVAQ